VTELYWGELTPGDVVVWKVSTSQGPRLTLLVINRYESHFSATRGNSIVEFLDMESGKVRQHDCDNARPLSDLNAFVVERGHASDA